MLTLQSDKSDTLTLTSTGTGDLSELSSALQPSRASFAYAKVRYNNDEHSFREKFILIIWIGEEVKIMRRAKVRSESVKRADKQGIGTYCGREECVEGLFN